MSMFHFSDDEYFKSLEPCLARADVVFFEGHKDDRGKAIADLPERFRWEARMQRAYIAILDVSRQSQWEESVRDGRWVGLDVPWEELDRFCEARGIEFMTPEGRRQVERIETWLQSDPPTTAVRQARSNLHARIFSDVMSNVETVPVDVKFRDARIFAGLKRLIDPSKHKRVVLMCGALHTLNLEARIVQHFGVRYHSTSWHTAFSSELISAELNDGNGVPAAPRPRETQRD